MDKNNVVHIHKRVPDSFYKTESAIICGNMDEPIEFASHETNQVQPNKYFMISCDYVEGIKTDLIGE